MYSIHVGTQGKFEELLFWRVTLALFVQQRAQLPLREPDHRVCYNIVLFACLFFVPRPQYIS